MPKFKYEIQKGKDQVISGTVDAEDLMAASEYVRQQGGYVIRIEPAPTAADWIEKVRNFRIEAQPGLKDVLYFTKQLAVMIRAGISIRDAIEGIADQVENQRFKKIMEQIRHDVEGGLQFSEALEKHPKVFSGLYVNMVRASEMSGTFAHMLERIAEYLEQQAETRSMIKGAMIYPAVLFTMSVAAVIFLLTWVLPRFMVVFKGKEQLLPASTKMLLAMSLYMQHQWYVLIGVLGIVVLGIFIALRTEQGRRVFDIAKLKMPLLKKMFRAVYIARGLQTMGELINAGVPLPETLEITSDISGNCLYSEMWTDVRTSVMGGNKIVAPLQNNTLLPAAVVQMIGAGEESGRLGSVLEDVAAFYAKELKDTIKAVTALLEPLMIVFMGFVIGFIAMSIILPVFKMSKVATTG